jgi:hypothetical protein
MYDTGRVRDREGRRGRFCDTRRVLDRELSLTGESVAKRFAVDEGHREPRQRLAVRAWTNPRVEHGNDVRVLQPRCEANLTQEPLDSDRAGKLRIEHLERNKPIVAQVASEPYRRHSPTPQLPLYEIAAGKSGVQVIAQEKARQRCGIMARLDAGGKQGARGARMTTC